MDQALMCPWCRLIKKTIAAQLLHNYTHIPSKTSLTSSPQHLQEKDQKSLSLYLQQNLRFQIPFFCNYLTFL